MKVHCNYCDKDVIGYNTNHITDERVKRVEVSRCRGCDIYGEIFPNIVEILYDKDDNMIVKDGKVKPKKKKETKPKEVQKVVEVQKEVEEIVEEKPATIEVKCVNCDSVNNILKEGFNPPETYRIETKGCPKCKYNPKDFLETYYDKENNIIKEHNPFG